MKRVVIITFNEAYAVIGETDAWYVCRPYGNHHHLFGCTVRISKKEIAAHSACYRFKAV